MAKGRQEHDERVAIVQSFGKDLARRSKSRCELCEESGLKLKIFEVPPGAAEPNMNRCILICETCFDQAENPKRFQAGEHWRCLAGTAWSEVPAVQVMAVRLLKRMADSQAWAREALEELFLDEEVEAWVTEGE